MTTKILITGISGFLGGALASRGVESGYSILGLSRRPLPEKDCKVRQTDYSTVDLQNKIQSFEPEFILHAAGPSSVPESYASPDHDFEKSVNLFQHLLEAVRLTGQRSRIICLSSAAVYGNATSGLIREDAVLQPISPYGFHKQACELLAKEYAECFGVNTQMVRLFSVFGPGQKKLILWEIFKKLSTQPEVSLEGTGQEERDFAHVDDIVRSVFSLLGKSPAGYDAINVASGKSLTVLELVGTIMELMNIKKPVHCMGKGKPGHPAIWRADISKVIRLTGSSPQFDFRGQLSGCLKQWQRCAL